MCICIIRRNNFIWSHVQDDVKSIPGIGDAGEARLSNALGGGPIRTTFDILQKFVSLRTPDMTTSDHYTAFVRWLCIKGISNFKNDIVIAVAGKTCLLLILLCIRYRHFIIDPPE